MTKYFTQVIERASELPDDKLDKLAALIDDVIDNELWDQQFAASEDMLARLSDEVMKDFHAGKTREGGFGTK